MLYLANCNIIILYLIPVWFVPFNMLKFPSKYLYCLFQGGASFLDLFVIYASRLSLLSVLSIPCSLAVICWERADPLALLSMMFSCVYVTFPYGVSDQMWYLNISFPGHCLLL